MVYFDVRLAREDDVAELIPCYEWLFAPPGARPASWEERGAVSALRDAIASENAAVLVADASVLIGFATVYLDLRSVRFGQRAWVEDLAVAPGARSRGVGKALLDLAKAWAREHGLSDSRWSRPRPAAMPTASMSASARATAHSASAGSSDGRPTLASVSPLSRTRSGTSHRCRGLNGAPIIPAATAPSVGPASMPLRVNGPRASSRRSRPGTFPSATVGREPRPGSGPGRRPASRRE